MHARTWRLPAIYLLMFALVGAQVLGFMHSVLHTQHGSGGVHAAVHAAHAEAAAPEAAHEAHEAHEAHGHAGWLHDLFALHDDQTDCRIYDGMGAQPFACQAAIALPQAAPSQAFLLLLQGDFVARWAALFDARGPPPSR